MNQHKSKYWIVVANASKLKIFASNHDLHKIDADLTFVQELDHDAGRLKDCDLEDDRPGRYKTDLSKGGSAYEHKTDAKEVEREHFAREIVSLLQHAKQTEQYEQLIIVAHDHFYGILKSHFDHLLQDAIYQTILKDYTQLTTADLAKMLLNEVSK